ncbi:MAG: hypothetical protein MUD08_04185, partial [Cytophagales bacterium]|nr:hypothetical protein [Cytophagales bacterium]
MKKSYKNIALVFVIALIGTGVLQAQTLYWVGGGGDTEWSNPLNWSGSSGGAGGAGPPAATNDVVFNGASFAGPGGIVTVTGIVACRAMTWTNQGTDNPTLQFSANSTLNIHGAMTLDASMSVGLADNGERIVFAGTGGPHAVTSAGKVLPQVRFDGVGGTWNLADNLTVSPTRSLRVANGTLNTLNRTVDCGYFIVEGAAPCAVNIGNSRLNIRGNTDNGTPVLDLRNPNLTWTTPGASAVMQFTNPTSYVALYTGSTAKTLPDLRFESIPANPADGPADVDIHTGDGAARITFREIRLTRNTGSQMVVTGTSPKTYSEDIILPDNFNTGGAGQRVFNGTAAAPPNNNIFMGEVLIGDNAGVVFNGNNTFQQRVLIEGTQDIEDAVRFTADCIFNDVVDITGSYFVFPYRQANVRFNNATFNDDVFLRGKDAVFRFGGFVEQDAGQDFNITDDARAIFTGTEDNTFSDGIRTGPEECNFNGNFRLGKRSVATFTNSLSNTFTNLFADNFSVMEFTPMPGTDNTVTGTVTLAGGCHVWVYMSSGVSGRQADVSFNNAQNWTGTVVQDLNRTGTQPINVNNGVNNGNNTGVNFLTSGGRPALYWVGGHPNNLSGDNNWSNPRNWAENPNDPAQQANGTIALNPPNGCIPDARTNVVFNALSFSAGGVKYTQVNVDAPIAFCRDMTWTDDVNANTGGTLPRFVTTSALNTAMVNGNLRFAPSDRMQNYFSGAFEFTANGPALIDANGTANGPTDAASVTRFNGHVIFSGRGGEWQLNSDILVNGGTLGNMIFEYGSVSVIDSLGTSRNITLDGNWFVRRPQDGGAQATVNLGQGTVTFNGVNNNASPADNPNNPNPQYIIAGPPVAPNLNDFYNLVVNRQGNDNPDKAWANNANDVVVWNRYDVSADPGTTSGGANPNTPFNTGITVRNNLTVTRGNLWDSGFQIVGNATGILTVATDAKLHLGSREHSEAGNNSPMTSRFPTGFTRANIDLQPGSTVVYRAHGHQDVSDVPLYANLYNFNPNKDESSLATLNGAATRKRLALGELQINGRLTVERGILFADNGFQINGTAGTSGLTMQDGGILMLGSSAMDVATSYGTGSDPANNTTGFLTIIAQNTQ